MKESLTLCPKCNSDACYTTPLNETNKKYFCFGCGYTTSDLQKVGEFNLEEYEETLPYLYRDIKYTDQEGRVWYPAVINLPDKGTVFLNGKSIKEAQWSGIQVRELSKEEQKQLANRGITHKSDASTLKSFGSDFIEALDYIGFFTS